jgi:UDP-N-acetylmuramoyl-tripeptide--D-alanyl-D-alanine ligase
MRLAVADALRWTGGELIAGPVDAVCASVAIDSRKVAPGALFVAIRGPRHDAHAFLADTVRAGAAALLVERAAFAAAGGAAALPDAAPAVAVIGVDDTTAALGVLAAGHRRRFAGPVIAITGSNGKTTTKEMTAAILSARAPCLKTEGNLNNQFGLPLTLLRLAPEHRAAVVEIGMNHPGEIAPLAAIAAPTVGVITNVGTAHIEHMGSQDGIAREKGALFEALAPGAVAVANADDSRVVAQLARTRARPLRFGRSAAAEVRAEREAALADGGVGFELVAPAGRVALRVHGVGTVLVINALAAAAGALAAGASLDDVATGLEAWRPPAGRMQRIALPRDVVVLDDTYNANPQSMEVALRSLAALKGASRGLVVVGDMGELGAAAPAAHRAAGRLAAELRLELLFALGEHAVEVVAGAVEGGMAPERAFASRDPAELAGRVRAALRGGDRVLVKGSRSMRMERIVEALRRPETDGAATDADGTEAERAAAVAAEAAR